MAEDHGAGDPQETITLLIMLLIHVSRAIDRCPGSHDVALDLALRTLAIRLNTYYQRDGAAYGDDEAGFRVWAYARWPAPPVA